MPNDERPSGFRRFNDLTELLEGFGKYCYIDYRVASLLRDKNNSLGGAERIKELYEIARSRLLDVISPYGISFAILCDNDGNWVAFPNLPDTHPFSMEERLFFGTNHDWQTTLVDAVARMCGLEPNDDIRQHMIMM